MKRSFLLVAAALLSLVVASCADRGATDLGPVPPGAASPSASPVTPTEATTPPAVETSTPAPNVETMTFEVWFARGEHLFVTHRTVPFSPRIGSAAVTALLEGPDVAERAAGVGTAVPDGVRLLGLTIENGVASVDLTGDFESGGGSLLIATRLAQLTYTLTQFRTVDGVDVLLDGEPIDTFSGEGFVLDRPMSRGMWKDLLPAILVESPGIGQRVSSPITIGGTADVFEATVSIAVLDAQGREIVRTFTTATCGTGCRGDFSAAIRFDVGREQAGTVRVYESSAEDGRAINVVEIPVTLTP
jgi:immunoglobulin-like protein involved in spore germination/sporulation and spore germination protein